MTDMTPQFQELFQDPSSSEVHEPESQRETKQHIEMSTGQRPLKSPFKTG